MKLKIDKQEFGCMTSGFMFIKYAVFKKRWPWTRWKFVESFSDENAAKDLVYCLKNKLPYIPA